MYTYYIYIAMQVDQNKQEHTVIGYITQTCVELGLGSGLSIIGESESCEKLTSPIGSTISDDCRKYL